MVPDLKRLGFVLTKPRMTVLPPPFSTPVTVMLSVAARDPPDEGVTRTRFHRPPWAKS